MVVVEEQETQTREPLVKYNRARSLTCRLLILLTHPLRSFGAPLPLRAHCGLSKGPYVDRNALDGSSYWCRDVCFR